MKKEIQQQKWRKLKKIIKKPIHNNQKIQMKWMVSLDKYYIPNLDQDQTNYVNRPVSHKKIEVNKNLPIGKKKAKGRAENITRPSKKT